MNLTLDIGNTAVKWATFEGRSLVESGKWHPEGELNTLEKKKNVVKKVESFFMCFIILIFYQFWRTCHGMFPTLESV